MCTVTLAVLVLRRSKTKPSKYVHCIIEGTRAFNEVLCEIKMAKRPQYTLQTYKNF